jgi:hypothetical protein
MHSLHLTFDYKTFIFHFRQKAPAPQWYSYKRWWRKILSRRHTHTQVTSTTCGKVCCTFFSIFFFRRE